MINVTKDIWFSPISSPNQSARDKFGSMVTIDRVESVQVRHLDALEGNWSGVAPFLKEDTQITDAEVVEGTGESIEGFRGIQLEVALHPPYDHTADLPNLLHKLRDLGFELAPLNSLARHSFSLIEADHIFRNARFEPTRKLESWSRRAAGPGDVR